MKLEFTIYGPPVGKQRPRVTRRGTFTPKATRSYEKLVKNEAGISKFGERAPLVWRMDRPTRFQCAIYFSDNRRRDIENVGKAIADALNGVLYEDDSQIVDYHLLKFIDRENPRVDVCVEAIEQ